MTDPRTTFAAGASRPWPLALGALDRSGAVLVRHAGENSVFASPHALAARLREAEDEGRRFRMGREFCVPPWPARAQWILADAPAEVLIGFFLGLPFAGLVARLLLS